ncbi:MAG: S9 family peptidase [Candidatus Obscuribacterales bacterium]|nr:S9 family peptidase [Candidatus Obscuribacterales bacterium]
MTAPKTKPYGTWTSPISAEMLVSKAVKLGQTFIDKDRCYWLETRPSEKGRSVLVAADHSGKIEDISPQDYNLRTAVHEYGGGAAIIADGKVFFSNFHDHRVYEQTLGSKSARPLTKEGVSRYADFCFDAKRNRLILIREDHADDPAEPLNFLEVLSLEGNTESEMLLAGSDFFSSPRISPDGRLLAWLTWKHPDMPWDESKLWTGNLGNDGSLSNIQHVAGGKGESVAQPEWGPDGTLYFASDRNGWWNLHASYSGLVEPLVEMQAEFAYPHWVFGLSNYCILPDNKIICSYTRNGFWQLSEFDPDSRVLTDIDTPYKDISYLRACGNKIVFRAGAADRFAEIVSMDLESKELKVLRTSNACSINSKYFSEAEAIEFPSSKGQAYAFFYEAKNPDFAAPSGNLPPLIVKSHGGPTSACSSTLELGIQYWTSRGFSVVDVNYGGSSGFGREYRERLSGNWGIVDVDDCVSAVKYLTEAGKIDPHKVAITGGSAGGYTTLCALTFQSDFFAVGASYYGVSDLSSLATDTHKFESRYLDGLIGPYPERKDLYEERSPLQHADKINCPIIFLQGLEDKVVPPSQSEAMVEALKTKKIPVCYLSFEGEQHGFRKADTIKSSIEAELSFFCKVMQIERDDLVPVPIINEEKLLPVKSSK